MEVSVDWMPFFLNPDMAPEGEPLHDHIARKYGPSAAAKFGSPESPLNAAGQKCEPPISFNATRRMVNTLDAHRVVEYCKKTTPELEDQLMEVLFKSYFESAEDVSQRSILKQCAGEAGLDAEKVASFLETNELSNETQQSAWSWSRKGVSGVPFFVFPREGQQPMGFSGAQPPEVILQVIKEVSST